MRTPVDQIRGNASDVQKARMNDATDFWIKQGNFAFDVATRVVITDADIVDQDDGMGRRKKTVRAIFELLVMPDMCNGSGNLHGGCSAYLADTCTTATYMLHDDWAFGHISAALDVIYHAPAPEGTNLRIICTLIALGGRIGTSRCEIWDKDKGRLVSSASHLKMKPSAPKTKL
ncbi:hypothetical protein FRB94_007560 [Tulasnella sp. JGI-2019a]|nr:hypothetical protein FRB94_007560 [Tulasnella sp. JGI-2019a]KAG9016106.1 hypothetical protein FRB93_011580 [Tulasnella sp. JGI-2019a]KAG9028367.1 hypothetical protein FRB95_006549 [Tulasnella sp. JGI-2019a]